MKINTIYATNEVAEFVEKRWRSGNPIVIAGYQLRAAHRQHTCSVLWCVGATPNQAAPWPGEVEKVLRGGYSADGIRMFYMKIPITDPFYRHITVLLTPEKLTRHMEMDEPEAAARSLEAWLDGLPQGTNVEYEAALSWLLSQGFN